MKVTLSSTYSDLVEVALSIKDLVVKKRSLLRLVECSSTICLERVESEEYSTKLLLCSKYYAFVEDRLTYKI